MLSRGYASDTGGSRKSARKQDKKAVLVFDWAQSGASVHYKGSQDEVDKARKAGKEQIIAAADINQSQLTNAVEIPDQVAVRFLADRERVSAQTIASNVSTESVFAAKNPVKMFTREENGKYFILY